MFAWIRHGAAADGTAMTLDLDLLDAAGTVCAQLRGLSFEEPDAPLALQQAVAAQPQPRTAPSSVEETIERFLRQCAAEELRATPDALAPDASYFDLGFTSMGVANLVRKTNLLLSADLPPTIVFEYPTIRSLAAWLAQAYGSEIAASAGAVPAATVHPPAAPLAVAGTVTGNAVPAGGKKILEQIALQAGNDDLAGYEKLTF